MFKKMTMVRKRGSTVSKLHTQNLRSRPK